MPHIATPAEESAFNDAFWKAQPPPVQKLQTIDDLEQRKMIAAVLADLNYRVHVPIMVWGWSAYSVMSLAAGFGYTWLPVAGEVPVQMAPGISMPGTLQPYDPKFPSPRAIKVSLDFEDYPPFTA